MSTSVGEETVVTVKPVGASVTVLIVCTPLVAPDPVASLAVTRYS